MVTAPRKIVLGMVEQLKGIADSIDTMLDIVSGAGSDNYRACHLEREEVYKVTGYMKQLRIIAEELGEVQSLEVPNGKSNTEAG